MSLNHIDFCEMCGYFTEKCGKCNGRQFLHKWIVDEVTGTYQPKKVSKPVLRSR